MKKIFWNNPYQKSLSTHVRTIEEDRILFEETIIFSFSGGQESDVAWVNGFQVIDSLTDGNLIYYTLPKNHSLVPGCPVLMEIDWPRRHKLMRLHFAAELILELVMHKLSIKKIGAHIAEDKARIDFAYENNITPFLSMLLSDYQAIINKNMPIKTGFSDEATQRRFWEIDGFAKVPCGGTHVKSTAEVGLVTLKRVNIGKDKERIEIYLNNRQRP